MFATLGWRQEGWVMFGLGQLGQWSSVNRRRMRARIHDQGTRLLVRVDGEYTRPCRPSCGGWYDWSQSPCDGRAAASQR